MCVIDLHMNPINLRLRIGFCNIYLEIQNPPNTLPETNIAPENRAPQYESSIPTIHFEGLC